jgi:hypothetical protein
MGYHFPPIFILTKKIENGRDDSQYEFKSVKCRNWDKLEGDLSRSFSTQHSITRGRCFIEHMLHQPILSGRVGKWAYAII